jgi:fructose-1,6-bisphosphatase I
MNKSLHQFLYKSSLDNSLQSTIFEILRASKYVANAISTEDTGKNGNINAQGENQLALDMKSDKIFCDILSESNLISSFSSEEQEDIKFINSDKGDYSVAFDPLDGSSLVDSNGCIGSIFGIWKSKTVLGKTGNDLVAAGYIQYGPRTKAILSFQNKTHEFTLSQIGEYHCSRENIEITDNADYFAIGNITAINDNEKYRGVLDYFINSKKILRYAGGMVPDINTILSKGSGVFTYPSCNKYSNGKLRLLYECAPISFIIKNSGGYSLTEKGENILDIKIEDVHQRTSILTGSKKDVIKVSELLK